MWTSFLPRIHTHASRMVYAKDQMQVLAKEGDQAAVALEMALQRIIIAPNVISIKF